MFFAYPHTCLSIGNPFCNAFLSKISRRYLATCDQPLLFSRKVAFAVSLTQNWRLISALVCVRACHKGYHYILKTNLSYSVLPYHPGISGWLKRLSFNCRRFSTSPFMPHVSRGFLSWPHPWSRRPRAWGGNMSLLTLKMCFKVNKSLFHCGISKLYVFHCSVCSWRKINGCLRIVHWTF